MKGQTHSTTQTIHVRPTETQGQAPRPATGLQVKTHLKAGTLFRVDPARIVTC